MERAEAHLPFYAFFCWCCVHLGCKISFDVSCADDMTGKQAGIELCAVPFFRRAFQVLLIPKFRPGGQRQRLALNKSTLLVKNDSKKASKPIESPHSVPGLCIQQNSLFDAA